MSPRRVPWLVLLTLLACDGGAQARIDALEARIAELERRTTDTAKAIEPLANVPDTLAGQQERAKTIVAEQASFAGRMARAEEAVAALQAARTTTATAVIEATPPTRPPTTLGTEGDPKPEVGVPACDEYLRKYRACVMGKMPEASRAAMLDALEQSAKAWREVATGPARSALADACKQASAAAKSAFESMGCTW